MALLSEINQPFGRALENQRSNKVTKALAEIVQQQKRNGPQLQTDEAAEKSYAVEIQQIQNKGWTEVDNVRSEPNHANLVGERFEVRCGSRQVSSTMSFSKNDLLRREDVEMRSSLWTLQ